MHFKNFLFLLIPSTVVLEVYLHFRYLDLVGIVLSAKVMPRSRPRRIRAWIRICRTCGHEIVTLHLCLCVVLLQLQLQGLMVYHGATFEDHRRSCRRPSGA